VTFPSTEADDNGELIFARLDGVDPPDDS